MNDNKLQKSVSIHNILGDITTLKDDVATIKYVTAELDNAVKFASSTATSYELDRLDSEILKLSNDITNINTQLDELYFDIKLIKDILNI
jgi:hypothetical protein